MTSSCLYVAHMVTCSPLVRYCMSLTHVSGWPKLLSGAVDSYEKAWEIMATVHGRFYSSTHPWYLESCLVNRLGMRATFWFDYFGWCWDDKDHCCCHFAYFKCALGIWCFEIISTAISKKKGQCVSWCDFFYRGLRLGNRVTCDHASIFQDSLRFLLGSTE